MHTKPLSEMTKRDVKNIVVYISDSFRYDHIPSFLAEKGLLGKAIAPSTFTASSIPSIFSGLYPKSHRIWGFDSGLKGNSVFTHINNAGYGTSDIFSWPVKAVEAGDGPVALSELDQSKPFLYVMHHMGGHSPYGDTVPPDWQSMEDYFRSFSAQEHRERYAKAITHTVSRFEELIDDLDDAGILDETLVIFTSDHGELLGERGGIWGHGNVITPELVEVPMLFIGPGIPRERQYERLLSGIDIAPTIMSLLKGNVPREMEGVDLWEEVPLERRKVRADLWNQTKYDLIDYAATSLWDDGGGYVQRIGSLSEHTLFTFGAHWYKYDHSHLSRSVSPFKLFRLYRSVAKKRLKYGSPSFSVNTVHSTAPGKFEKKEDENVEPDHDRLRQLGYLQ